MNGITEKEIQQEIEEAEKGYYRDEYIWHGVDGGTLDIDPENDERIIEKEGNTATVTWNGEGTFQEDDGEKKEIEYIAILRIRKDERGWIVSENWDLDIQFKNNGGR